MTTAQLGIEPATLGSLIDWERPKTPKKTYTRQTIRSIALELLCQVAYYEERDKKPGPDNVIMTPDDSMGNFPNLQSVGISYGEILRRVQILFPNCRTSVADLVWFAVKIRAESLGFENLRLPQRRLRPRQAR